MTKKFIPFSLIFSLFSSLPLLGVCFEEIEQAKEEKTLKQIRSFFTEEASSPLIAKTKIKDLAGYIVYDKKGAPFFHITTPHFGFKQMHFLLMDEEGFYPLKKNTKTTRYQFHQALSKLPHGQFEIRLHHSPVAKGAPLQPKEIWDSTMGKSKVKEFYHKEIYPKILQKILRILESHPEVRQIVDLGGGEGSLLEFIADSLPEKFPNKKISFLLVEQNHGLFEKAKGKKYTPYPIKLLEKSVFEIGSSHIKKSAIVVSSGFIANEVLNEDEKKTLPGFLKKLPEGTHLIVTGLTPPLVDRAMLIEADFKVHQMVFRERIARSLPQQIYVARKTSFVTP